MDTNTDIKYTHTSGYHNINVDKFVEACKDNKLEYITYYTYLPSGTKITNMDILENAEREKKNFMLHVIVTDPYGNRIRLHSDNFKLIEDEK